MVDGTASNDTASDNTSSNNAASSGTGATILLAVLGLVVGAVVVAVAVWRTGDPPTEPVAVPTSTEASDDTTEVDPAVYLEAWVRSAGAEVVVAGHYGVLTDDRSGDELVLGDDAAVVHRARLGERSIDQLDTQVTLTDEAGTRSCQYDGEESLQCGPVAPVADPEQSAAALEGRFVGDAEGTGDYVVFVVDPPAGVADIDGVGEVTCFALTAVRAVPLSAWGQSTTECFDEASGALVHRLVRSADEVRLTVIDSVRPVSEDDLAPVEP